MLQKIGIYCVFLLIFQIIISNIILFSCQIFFHFFRKINVISRINEFHHYFIKIVYIFPVLISPPKLKKLLFHKNKLKDAYWNIFSPLCLFYLEIIRPQLPGLFSLFVCMYVCVCMCACVCVFMLAHALSHFINQSIWI